MSLIHPWVVRFLLKRREEGNLRHSRPPTNAKHWSFIHSPPPFLFSSFSSVFRVNRRRFPGKIRDEKWDTVSKSTTFKNGKYCRFFKKFKKITRVLMKVQVLRTTIVQLQSHTNKTPSCLVVKQSGGEILHLLLLLLLLSTNQLRFSHISQVDWQDNRICRKRNGGKVLFFPGP